MIEETGIEYKIFFETFFYLKITGLWIPTTIKQRWLQLCYRLYTFYATISVCLLISGIIIYIALSRDIFLSFVENWGLAGIACNTLYGVINIIMKRQQIISLIRTKLIGDTWTRLRDDEEVKIIAASNKVEQKMVKCWMGLLAANCVMNSLNPIINNPNNYLIYNSWVPCDRHESSCFWICWSYQLIFYLHGSMIHVASDCIIFNFIERVCSNVRILQHRLELLPQLVSTGVIDTAEKEKLYLIKCILDHQNIYSSAQEISKIFRANVSVHFILIFSIVCTCIYILSMQPLFSDTFTAVLLFLCCILAQSFIHCWYGYKLTRISDDISYTIFSMNWLELRRDTIKDLRFVMLFASKSIPLFNNFLVELSPEMFLKMLKVSYSAFNLLQTQR